MVEIDAGGVRLQLLAQRAAFLPDHGTLLVADVHIGKAASFRRLGVPVPAGTTAATLVRLSAAVAATGARAVVFLGDLIHSARSAAPDTFGAVAAWRAAHPRLTLTLVRGNHDRHAGDPPREWGIDCLAGPLAVDGLALSHHPEAVAGAYVLAGHVHPAVVLGGGGASGRLRLPCFHVGPRVAVLPAFGEFTGMHVLARGPGDRVYAVVDDAVHAVPGRRRGGAVRAAG